jgi:hypothetical protein
MKLHRAFTCIAWLFVALTLTACGNAYRTTPLHAKQEVAALATAPTTPDGLTESDRNALTYACPDKPNVVPDYDYDFTGTGYFTVCPSKSNLADILVHGSSHSGGAICVFPALIAANGQVFAKPDLDKAGAPWAQCTAPDVDGIHLTFSQISYNAAFIVDSTDLEQMSLCIQGGQYQYCPKNYSFGRFRN